MDLELKRNDDEIRLLFAMMRRRSDVADLLEIEKLTLNYYIHIKPESKRYKKFEIKKRGGGVRIINAPAGGLKIIQKKLSYVLYLVSKLSFNAHGYVKNRSIISNAKIHEDKSYVLNVDLKDFFPSINFGRVRGLFMARPFSLPPNIATILAQICCHNNELPQGAPTSPIISNLICLRLDGQLYKFSKQNGCFYTRYVDDLTISTNKTHFPHRVASISRDGDESSVALSASLEEIIEKNGFLINDLKTRLQTRNRRQVVTGLTVNKFANVNRKLIRQIRAMLHALEVYGLESASNEFIEKYDNKHRVEFNPEVSFFNVLRGKIEFVGMVRGQDNKVYLNFRNKLSDLFPDLVGKKEFPKEEMVDSCKDVVIFTEGETDWRHIDASFKTLQAAGLFSGKNLEIIENHEKVGGAKLLSMCKHYMLKKHPHPTFFIFDRDDAKILKDVVVSGEDWKVWGNNVFSVVLPVPDFRKDHPEISIEFLYNDDEIKTLDCNGRRLFLSNEFMEKSGRNEELNLTCQSKKKDAKHLTIIDESVYDSEGINVALTKNDFAKNIQSSKADFGTFDFSGFIPLFDMIFELADSQ